jgi:hypothetical protein
MIGRGDLLALIDGAPGPLRTLEAAIERWVDMALVPAVQDQLARLTGGEPVARDNRLEPIDTVGGGPEAEVSISYVLVSLPDRWRVIGRGHVAVSDGRHSWVGTGSLVTERATALAAIHDAGPVGACLHPGALLGLLDFDKPEPDEVSGRACWAVTAGLRPLGRRGSLAGAAMPGVSRLPDEFVGVEHRFWFDAATGIVLRHQGSIGGRPCSATELTDVVADQPIPDDEFAPPPEAIVRSRHELLRDHLTELGVDPDAVDLDDPHQVRRALRQGFAAEGADSLARRRERHVPVGPAPDDPDAARAAIRHAVEHIGDAGPQGELVNVQAGEGLAAVVDRAHRHAPGQPSQFRTTLDDARFLSADRAVIWYSVRLDGLVASAGAGREGYAVLVDGRWLVERATFADVAALAGVACPPPPPQ